MAAQKFVALVLGKLKEVYASVTSTPNAIVAMDASGRIDSSVLPVGVGAEVVSATASEALSAGNFVNIYDNGGTISCRKADATTNGKPADGFVLAAVSNGATATIYTAGNINTQVTGLTIGVDYYLSTTPGAITTTAPSTAGNIVQRVGRSTKTTEIAFNPYVYVELA